MTLHVGFNWREITAYDFVNDHKKWPSEVIEGNKVKQLLGLEYISCCNESQKPVLDIIERRFEVRVKLPFISERHRLKKGDRVLLIVVANLRRLQAYERYTAQELSKARIFFRLYRVTS